MDTFVVRIPFKHRGQEWCREYGGRSFISVHFHQQHRGKSNQRFIPEQAIVSGFDTSVVYELVTDKIPKLWNMQDRQRFLREMGRFYWDKPYLFKYYEDQIICRCTSVKEFERMLFFCYSKDCGGYFSTKKITAKVLQSRLYWPSLFKDAQYLCEVCPRC